MIEDQFFVQFGGYVFINKDNNDIIIEAEFTFKESPVIPFSDIDMIIDELEQARAYIQGLR